MNNRVYFSEGEADEWFLRNIAALENKQGNQSVDLLVQWLAPFKSRINNILEVGCGSGHFLDDLSNQLDAKGVGVDPSSKAVDYIGKNFPKLNAITGFGDDIRIKECFDLVHLGFYLCWVDRERYLKYIGEADRLVKPGGFLSIVDFDTPQPYSNEYSHREGVYSHKTNNANVFVASGLYTVASKHQFSHQGFHFDEEINERVSLTLLYKEKNIFKGA